MRAARPSRRAPRLVGLSGVIALALTLLSAWLPDDTLLAGYQIDAIAGLRARLYAPAPPAAPPVVVVGLDRRSLDDPRLAPLPRAMFGPVWAELAGTALSHGARVVVLDFILAYDTGELARSAVPALRGYDTPLLRLLHREGRGGRLVLGRSAALGPAPRFAAIAGAGALGLVEIPLGPGNVAREVRPALAVGAGAALPTLSGLARAAMGDRSGATIHLIPPWRLDAYPAAALIDVLSCDDPAALDRFFAGRAVFVGSVLPVEDRVRGADRLIPPLPAMAETGAGPCALAPPVVRAATDASLPGVFMHAAATDAALTGWAPLPAAPGLIAALVAALSFAAALAALRLSLAAGIAAVAGLILAVPLAGAVLLEHGILLASAEPLWTPAAGFVAATSLRLGLLDRKARRLRRRFEQYLSPVVIARMIDARDLPEMGGEQRDVTLMFADLSGFTALSATMDSQQVMAALNRYLDVMAGEIRASGGYVDKFIGDAVMAMWNAPAPQEDHAGVALGAALRLHRAVAATAVAMAAEGLPALTVKAGLNSGPASVGNIGARNRRDYSAVGETVNVAARLEGLPPQFGTAVVLGPGTAERIGDAWRLLRIARVQVKGEPEPLAIFTPVAGPELPPIVGLDALIGRYEAAAAAFAVGEFNAAGALWCDLASADWPGAGPAGAMAGRAERLAADPPPDWDGVIVFSSK